MLCNTVFSHEPAVMDARSGNISSPDAHVIGREAHAVHLNPKEYAVCGKKWLPVNNKLYCLPSAM
jgi:hypothetical protein